MEALSAEPLTLSEANFFVGLWHRHHKLVVGHRFSIGALAAGRLCGVAIVGRPVARACEQYLTAEITRLVTNGAENACSFLYGRCARIAKEMGFKKIQTYILETEPGTSLKASGWRMVALTAGGDWNNGTHKGRRTDQPQCKKQRWERVLCP